MQEKWSVLFTVSVITWPLFLCSIKNDVLSLYGVLQSSIPSLHRVQKRLRILVSDILFWILQTLSHNWRAANLLQLYRYYHGKCSVESHSLVPQVCSFIARTVYAGCIVTNHPHSLRIFSRTFSVDSLLHYIPITTIFTCSMLGLIFNLHSCLPKMYQFHCNPLTRGAPETCTGWNSMYKIFSNLLPHSNLFEFTSTIKSFRIYFQDKYRILLIELKRKYNQWIQRIKLSA